MLAKSYPKVSLKSHLSRESYDAKFGMDECARNNNGVTLRSKRPWRPQKGENQVKNLTWFITAVVLVRKSNCICIFKALSPVCCHRRPLYRSKRLVLLLTFLQNRTLFTTIQESETVKKIFSILCRTQLAKLHISFHFNFAPFANC